MAKRKMSWILLAAALLIVLFIGWRFTSRSAYESAEYTVLQTDGSIELRQYPDLMLASTEMKSIRGDDGSFGRLFRYISGGNEESEKVAMTTPVFMEPASNENDGQMGFVIPKDVAAGNIPSPTSDQVQLTERPGGRFAVIRFAGRQNPKRTEKELKTLNAWIDRNGLEPIGTPEFAGYDPPWTPGPFRRNEILIRVAEKD